MLIFRQKSFQFCTPPLKKPDNPYYHIVYGRPINQSDFEYSFLIGRPVLNSRRKFQADRLLDKPDTLPGYQQVHYFYRNTAMQQSYKLCPSLSTQQQKQLSCCERKSLFQKNMYIKTCMYIKSMQYNAYCAKGGFLSEKSGGFLLLPTLPKNIPFYYPKLLHPVHSIDKIIIKVNTF